MTFTTIPNMASELGLSKSKVHYLVRKLRIDPFDRVGQIGLYPADTLDKVRTELEMLRKYAKR